MLARHGRSRTDAVRRPGFIETLYEYMEALISAMLLLVLLFTFLFRVADVKGNSMQPTLHSQERLILTIHNYTPRYGDIVVINRYTEDPLVKRVIGLAGDTILIDEATGQVYRNGEQLHESYIAGSTTPKELQGTVTVPEGCLFVLGDNRAVSKDSRYTEIGMIKISDVVGKAVWRVWPLSKFGRL